MEEIHWRSLPPRAEDAAYYAEAGVKFAQEYSGYDLDYSVNSLHVLETVIETMRQNGLISGRPEVTEWLFLLGCYVGEIFVRNGKGRWRNAEEKSASSVFGVPLVIETAPDNFCNVIGRVFKRMNEGPNASLPDFYRTFSRKLARPDNLPVGETSSQPGPIATVILRQQMVASSRTEALRFVIECRGDLKRIEAKMRKESERIVRHEGKGPMAPSASPRIWLDNYLATLQEAFELIAAMLEEGKTWDSPHND